LLEKVQITTANPKIEHLKRLASNKMSEMIRLLNIVGRAAEEPVKTVENVTDLLSELTKAESAVTAEEKEDDNRRSGEDTENHTGCCQE